MVRPVKSTLALVRIPNKRPPTTGLGGRRSDWWRSAHAPSLLLLLQAFTSKTGNSTFKRDDRLRGPSSPPLASNRPLLRSPIVSTGR